MTNAYNCDLDLLTANDDGTISDTGRGMLFIHTFEGQDLDAAAMARYQQSPAAGGSYHLVIDRDGKTVRENDDEFIPWAAMFTGNRAGWHISLAGRAAFTREQWLARPSQLNKLAEVLAAYSKAKNIPLVKLSPAEVKQRKRGVAGHADITAAWGESDHTDPGAAFPYDVVLTRANHLLNPAPPQPKENTMTPEQHNGLIDRLDFIAAQLTGPGGKGGWPQGGGRTLYDLAAAIAEIEGVPNTRDTVG